MTSHKISADRLNVVFASPPDEFEGSQVEAWVVPQGEPFPDPLAPLPDEGDQVGPLPPSKPQPSGKTDSSVDSRIEQPQKQP